MRDFQQEPISIRDVVVVPIMGILMHARILEVMGTDTGILHLEYFTGDDGNERHLITVDSTNVVRAAPGIVRAFEYFHPWVKSQRKT